MFVCKDKDGYMAAYNHKPHRGESEWGACEEDSVDVHKENGEIWYGIDLSIPLTELDYDNFKSLSWEDEPVEATVVPLSEYKNIYHELISYQTKEIKVRDILHEIASRKEALELTDEVKDYFKQITDIIYGK